MGKYLSHVLFWVFFLLWSSAIMEWHNFSLSCPTSYFGNVMHIASRLPIIMGATYIFVDRILPTFLFQQKSIWKLTLYTALLFLVTTVIDRLFIGLVDSRVFQIEGAFQCSIVNIDAIIRNALILLSVMGIAFVIRFYQMHLANEKFQHSLIQDKLSNQLSFLKAQVSPHFLFNALNNIYSDCVQKKEHEIASSIEHLSGIMRYLTYDSDTKHVSLEKEKELISNYINVEQMRISSSDDVSISFVAEGDFSQHKIIPVLLLPLVENTFKHGIQPEQTCYIHISMKMTGDILIFETRNTNHSKSTDSDGIGLSNVRERLSILYKDRHTFTIQEGNTDYVLSLQIDLGHEH